MASNRRTFLKTTSLAALAGVTGLAGCSSLPGLGGGGGGGNWLYDPSMLIDTGNKFYGTMNYAQLYQNRQYLPNEGGSAFQSGENSPVDPEQLETATGVAGANIQPSGGGGTVAGSMALIGSFSASDITSQIESEGQASQVGEYEGYTLYESQSGSTMGPGMGTGSATAAVTEGTMIIGAAGANSGEPSVSGEEAARAMIDANNGNATLLFGNNQYIDQLSNQMGNATLVVGGQVEPELMETMGSGGGGGGMGMGGGQFTNSLRAGGLSMQINGETTTFQVVGVYENSDAAQQTGAVELVNQMGSQMTEQSPVIDSLDASYNGAAVVVTITGQTKALFRQGASQVPGGALGPGGGQPRTPAGGTEAETPPAPGTPTPGDVAVSGDPAQSVVAFYTAINQGNIDQARQFVHPESPELRAQQLPEGASIRIENVETVEVTNERALVNADLTFVQGDTEQRQAVTYELRPHQGRWKLYGPYDG